MSKQGCIVMGRTGQYDSQYDWPVKVFVNPEKAAQYAKKAAERAAWIYNHMNLDNLPDGINEYDPGMMMYRPGTHYYVMSVEIDEEPYPCHS